MAEYICMNECRIQAACAPDHVCSVSCLFEGRATKAKDLRSCVPTGNAMQVTTEKVGPCTIAMDIHIEAEQVSRAFDRAYREFGRFTNVPGFRPGKAPRKILERFINPERLRQRVIELIANPAFREAVQQESITPLREPEVEFADLAEGQPWQFKATVAIAPQVTLCDYSAGIAVERPVFQVTEEDIQQQIEDLREEHARVKTVEGRGVQKGDFLIAEMTTRLAGSEKEAEPQRVFIRVGENIPGFDDAILGQKPDEERTFTLTYPQDYPEAERAGKEATFTLKVVSISERILPERTDEWVRSVTSYQTIDELREAKRQELQKAQQQFTDRIVRDRIIQQLIQRSTLEYPQVLVEEELDYLTERLGKQLAEDRISYRRYLQQNNLTEEQHQAQMREQAEANVRTRLVLQALAHKEGISVTDAEIDTEIERLLADHEGDMEQMRRNPAFRERVTHLIIQRKLEECLMQIARITDVPVNTR
jgi:trigger factor